uniref:Uncharacterized protein n=1 Tax=Cannabis sativa TaxID=3483 RepID=A0A803QBE7_CANSA
MDALATSVKKAAKRQKVSKKSLTPPQVKETPLTVVAPAQGASPSVTIASLHGAPTYAGPSTTVVFPSVLAPSNTPLLIVVVALPVRSLVPPVALPFGKPQRLVMGPPSCPALELNFFQQCVDFERRNAEAALTIKKLQEKLASFEKKLEDAYAKQKANEKEVKAKTEELSTLNVEFGDLLGDFEEHYRKTHAAATTTEVTTVAKAGENGEEATSGQAPES